MSLTPTSMYHRMGRKGAAFTGRCGRMTSHVLRLVRCKPSSPFTCSCGKTYATFTGKRTTVCPVKDCTVPRVRDMGPSVSVSSFMAPTDGSPSRGGLGSKISLRFYIVSSYRGGRTTCRILSFLLRSRGVRACLSSRGTIPYGRNSFALPSALSNVGRCVRRKEVTSCRSRCCPARVTISTRVRAFLVGGSGSTFLGGFSAS